MGLTAVFTLIIAFIIGRSFLLRWRAGRLDATDFQELDPEVKLAILKERLLEKPSERNLQNIEEYAKTQGICVDADFYRSLIKEQMRLPKEKEAMALDNELYEKQTAWIDSIPPFEIRFAAEAKEKGDLNAYIDWSLEATLRYYSDKKIESTLRGLETVYPKAAELLKHYLEFKEIRDKSDASDSSLERLQSEKQKWMDAVIKTSAK